MVLLVVVGAVALAVAPEVPAAPGSVANVDVIRGLRTWAMPIGIAALTLGATVLRASQPALRERGWELQAVGVGAIGIGWLAGIAASD